MYITPSTLMRSVSEQTLIKLSNDDYRATEVDMGVVEHAIQTACERIDGALRSRYVLPLQVVPTMLKSYALSLARYELYARRPEMKMPETVEKTYHQAIKELEQIARGLLHLGIKAITEPPTDPTGDLLPNGSEYTVRAKPRIDTEGY